MEAHAKANSLRIVDTLTTTEASRYYPGGLPSNFSADKIVDPLPPNWAEYYPRNPRSLIDVRQEARKSGWKPQPNTHNPEPELPAQARNPYGVIGQEQSSQGIHKAAQEYQKEKDRQTSNAGWNGHHGNSQGQAEARSSA